MDRHPVRDLLVGLFVLAGLGAIAYLSTTVGGLSYSGPGGLPVYATFDELGGLKLRSPVVLSGVKIGQVTGISLGKSLRARVDLELDSTLELPTDTSASIVTAGLLGDRYINLKAGGETELLKPGDEIAFTESAVILESLLGRFLYGSNDVKQDGEAAAEAPAAEAPVEVSPGAGKAEQK